MEVEVIPPKKHKVQRKKHHVETSDPEVIQLEQKYAVVDKKHNTALTEVVDPADVHKMLKKYGEDLDVDLYTIAKTFNFSPATVGKILNSEEYKEEYHAIKKKRGELMAQSGYEVAMTPFRKLMSGENIHPAMVKAATLASNYSLQMARAFNADFNPAKNEVGEGNVSVQVNTAVQLNI